MSVRFHNSWPLVGIALVLAGCGPVGVPAGSTRSTARTLGTGRTIGSGREVGPAPFNGASYRVLALPHESWVRAPSPMRIVFTDDGEYIATQTEAQLGVWGIATGKLVGSLVLPGGRGWPWHLGVAPDGNTLFTLNPGSPIVQFWDMRTGKPAGRWRIPVQGPSAFGLSPDGRQAFVTGWPGPLPKLQVYNTTTNKAVTLDSQHSTANIAFSPDKAKMAGWLPRNHHLRLWNAATGQVIWTTNFDLAPESDGSYAGELAFSPDGRYVGVPIGYEPGRHPPTVVVVVGAADGQERCRLPIAASGCVLGGRGPTLLVRTPEYGLRVFDLASNREASRFTVPGGRCLGLAVSPDGKTLAVGGIAPDGRGYAVYLTRYPDVDAG